MANSSRSGIIVIGASFDLKSQISTQLTNYPVARDPCWEWKNYDSIPFDLWTGDSMHADEPFQDNGHDHQQDIWGANIQFAHSFWSLSEFFFSPPLSRRRNMRWPNKRIEKGSSDVSLKCNEQEKGNSKQTNLYLYCFSYHKIEPNPFAWINFLWKKKRYATVVAATLWWNAVDRISGM